MRCTKCERRLDHGAIQESQRDYSYGIFLEELPSIGEIVVSNPVQVGSRCENLRLVFSLHHLR